jgi:hypothetical protein
VTLVSNQTLIIIVQELFFLHERARYQQYFSSVQTVISGTLIILSSYIAGTIGWRAWYYLFMGFTCCVLFVSTLFLVETKFPRPLVAYKGTTAEVGTKLASDAENLSEVDHAMTTSDERIIDNVNFAPRTRLSDMHILVNKADWMEAVYCIKHMAQMFFFPNVLWAFTMNGVFLAVNIAMGLTYSNILSGSFGWADKVISVAQAGQIVVAFICVPLLGYGSDFTVKFMSRRNGGVYEPEFRLVALVIPLLLGVLFVVLYGQAAEFPQRFNWGAIVIPLNGCKFPHQFHRRPKLTNCKDYFTFVGANISTITYFLDAYPTRGASSLVLLCAMRGVISFCLSYGTVDMYTKYGYDGAFGIFGGITALFGVLGVLMYIFGKKIRQFVSAWTAAEVAGKPTMG